MNVERSYLIAVPAFIKSGGSLTGNITGQINNTTIAANSVIDGVANYQTQDTSSAKTNGVNPTVLLTKGEVDLDLSLLTAAGIVVDANANGVNAVNLAMPSHEGAGKVAALANTVGVGGGNNNANPKSDIPAQINSGSYVINRGVNLNDPLIEHRSEFTDVSKFYGSDYFYTAIGFDKNDLILTLRTLDNNTHNIRFLGDSYVEETLLEKQIASMRKDALYLTNSSTTSNATESGAAEVKLLLDNAKAEITRLGLTQADLAQIAINGLSKSQVNSLQKDVVLFTMKELNGELILVPTIYLSIDTRNKLLGTTLTATDLNGSNASATITNALTASSINNDSPLSSGSIATGSTIFAKNNITITSSDLTNNLSVTNNGSITSALGNISIAANSLNNITSNGQTAQALIQAKLGNTTINTTNDILNIGANIKSNGVLSLTSANGNIINSAVIRTNDANLLSQNQALLGASFNNGNTTINPYQLSSYDAARTSGNITSSFLHSASLSGGAVTINAANDFTNLAANVTATKNIQADATTSTGAIAITAGDDINVNTLELRNRTETSWGNARHGGTTITDTTTNISSNISAEGNISLTTTGLGTNNEASLGATADASLTGSSIQIKGSDVAATGATSNITIDSKNYFTLANAIDSNYYESTTHKRGVTRRSDSTQIDYTESAVDSNLSAGNNISISTGADALIQGSNINTGNNLLIGSFTIAQNPDGSYQKDSNGNYITTDNTTVDNLTIKNAELHEYHYANTTRGYDGIAAAGIRLAPYALAPLQVMANINR